MGAPPIPLDRITKSLTIVDHAEHDIHEGRSFVAFYESSAPLPTVIGEETAIGFVTPAATAGRIHMIVGARANDASTFEIREDPTIVLDQGSNLTPFNKDRKVGTPTSGLTTNDAAPTVNRLTSYNVAEAAAGNLGGLPNVLHIETLALGGVAPFASILNSESRAQREWILRPETEYVIILTNLTANNTIHEIVLNWSEEPPVSSHI